VRVRRPVIIGSGLVARAFQPYSERLPRAVCIYTAGVSNSSCDDLREFERERQRLLETSATLAHSTLFVYFGTCSVDDPDSQNKNYVAHKRTMESTVRESRLPHLIFRLPQLAGVTPNPHTILNYLYSRIVRSERFQIWKNARRNIIDVEDAARIAFDLMTAENVRNETINIANASNSAMTEIVAAMQAAVGRTAIFDTIDRGGSYEIDTQRIHASMQRTGILFPADYLRKTVEKYYGHHVQHDS
jgi:nucleoside-diphosphate-sugar epimerase